MHYVFLLLILLITSTGCQRGYQDVDFDYVENNSEVDVDEFIYSLNTFVVSLNENRKHKLIFEDSEIFYDDEFVDKVWIKFITQDLVGLWDARKMLVEIVDGYLDRVNQDIRLVWYTRGHKLTPMNVDVTIVFESYLSKYVDPLYVQTLNLQDGMVYYYAADTFDLLTDFWHQRVEPYHKTRLLADAKARADMMYWDRKSGQKEKSALNKLFNVD